MATVHGKLIGPNPAGDSDIGTPTVDIQLCGYGSRWPRGIGVGGNNGCFCQVQLNGIGPTLPGIEFFVDLIGNDEIVPAGTYYTITTRDSNGDALQCNAYIFLGDGDYDVAQIDPFDPALPMPPLPPLIFDQLLVVSFDPNPVFPGDQFTAWQITLTGDVVSSSFTDLVPGNLYTLIVKQDAVGGWAFTWPDSGVNNNGGMVDMAPNAVTVQTYVCDDSGELFATGPALWWEP